MLENVIKLLICSKQEIYTTSINYSLNISFLRKVEHLMLKRIFLGYHAIQNYNNNKIFTKYSPDHQMQIN